MKAHRTAAMALLIGTLAVAGYALQGGARAQEDRQNSAEGKERPNGGGPMMMCPMMARLKGVELYADGPALLMARADELDLNEDQARKLRQIVEQGREEARKILTDEQRKQLAEAPEGPLSPMQIARMRMRDQKGDQERGQMCPMCMQMMRERMQKTDRPEQQ